MKKRLLTLFAMCLCLASNIHAEDLYLVGDGTIIGWTRDSELKRQPTKMTETSTNSGVYEWTGLLKHADQGFSIRKNTGWDGYYPTTPNYAISEVGGSCTYDTTSDNKWNPTNTDWGWYTVTLNTNDGTFSWKSFTPLVAVDGVYNIGTAEELNKLAIMTRSNVNNESYNVKLTADIDYTDYKDGCMAAIGYVEQFPFRGDFDGQNHTITVDLVAPWTHFSLFGTVEGTVHNLKVAGTITATTKNQIGGICGRLKGSSSKIYNCISAVEIADSNTGDGTIGGIVSVTDASTIENCAFYGKINTSRNSNGGIIGWANGGSTIKNCLIVADINWAGGVDFGRNNPTVTNSFKLDASDASLASGEMTYKLNGNVTGGEDWFQTIGTDAMPSPLSTSQKVYAIGSEGNRCDLNPLGTITSYTNSTPAVSSHTFVDGICSNCGTPDESYITATDGFYEISTTKQLIWFSTMVSYGSNTINGKLTADIALNSAWTTPIGTQSVPFKGTFDGQNHAITGFNLTYDGGRQGLFGQTNGATIRNFSIDGTITANGNAGGDAGVGVIGWAEASVIQNVHSSLIVDATSSGLGSTHVGGIVGSLRESGMVGSTIERSSFSGQMNGGSNKIDCFGCVVGYMKDRSIIRNCANYGKLTYSGSEGCAGGILAYTWASNGGKIENCLNIGEIDFDKSDNGGAIVGLLRAYSTSIVSNNYMLDGSASQPYGSKTDSNNTCTIASAAQIASGELCYLLNESTSGGTNWYQTIGTDTYPIPLSTSEPVYYVGSAEYTTFYDSDSDWALLGDATPYIGTFNGETSLHLTAIDDIPAGTAVVINGTYYNKVSTTATASTAGNVLLGSDGTVSGGDGIYALALKNSKVGFYPVASAVTIPAGKAYLSTSSEAKGFTFSFDDDPTGIKSIDNGTLINDNSEAVYNLAGQRMSKPAKGINIVGGKKVLY